MTATGVIVTVAYLAVFFGLTLLFPGRHWGK